MAATILCSMALWSQDSTNAPSQTAPDNTKINQRDRNSSEMTADQQKENTSDRQLTRQIRKALMQDKSLSTYAHNVKIISQDGVVTLKGPVKSEEEKMAIEKKAVEVAGSADKIHDELQVTGGEKPSANQ